MGDGRIFLKTLRDAFFHKDLWNEPTFDQIHLAGQYPLLYLPYAANPSVHASLSQTTHQQHPLFQLESSRIEVPYEIHSYQ